MSPSTLSARERIAAHLRSRPDTAHCVKCLAEETGLASTRVTKACLLLDGSPGFRRLIGECRRCGKDRAVMVFTEALRSHRT